MSDAQAQHRHHAAATYLQGSCPCKACDGQGAPEPIEPLYAGHQLLIPSQASHIFTLICRQKPQEAEGPHLAFHAHAWIKDDMKATQHLSKPKSAMPCIISCQMHQGCMALQQVFVPFKSLRLLSASILLLGPLRYPEQCVPHTSIRLCSLRAGALHALCHAVREAGAVFTDS